MGFHINNDFHNILRPFDVLPNFLSITSETMGNEHGICELPHELPNYLRLRIIGN